MSATDEGTTQVTASEEFISNDRVAAGLAVRESVLGPEYVERAVTSAANSPFGPEWQRFLTEYCWGRIWGSDDLPKRTRSLLTVALLAALGKPEELASHIRGARRNGCTKEEVRGALMQAACYAGVPVGVEGFRVADRVWAEG
jgi:4-carboxymuconolactone decarboxylase